MEKSVRKALSILDESYIDEYEIELGRIWRDVIHLNVGVLLLEKLKRFPFDLIQEKSTFWQITYTSLYESSILIIWRLMFDKKSATNVFRMKNKIAQNLNDKDYRDDFVKDHRKNELTAIVKKYKDTVGKIRHGRLAHSDKANFNWSLLPSFDNNTEISLKGLRKIRRAISQFFNLLCLKVHRGQWPFPYNPDIINPTEFDRQLDIDRIFRLLLKDNCLINMPEEQPGFWPYYKDHNLTEQDIEKLNELRKIIGLPEVP